MPATRCRRAPSSGTVTRYPPENNPSGPQSPTTEPGSSSITTFARHVYQAGSRVGAASEGSATNRQPNTLSIRRVAGARSHQDPRRAAATGGRGPPVAAAGLTCRSVEVMGSPVGTLLTPTGGGTQTAGECTGRPLASRLRSVLPGIDGGPGPARRRRRRRSSSKEPDRSEQDQRREDRDDDRAAPRADRTRRRRGRPDRRLTDREEPQAADRRVYGLLRDRIVALDRRPRPLVCRPEDRVREPHALGEPRVHEPERPPGAEIAHGRAARLVGRRHPDHVAGDLQARGKGRVGLRGEGGHDEL